MPPPADTPRTGPLSLAAALLVVLGLVAFGYGVAQLFATRADRAILGSGVGILLVGYGVLLVAVARGVRAGRRWSRAPAIATQLIQLPIAWTFRDDSLWWFGLLLGVCSAVVLLCLVLPSSTAIFVPDAGREPDDPA